MLARLSRIVLMVRSGEGLTKATQFYQTIGLSVVRATDDWAELVDETRSHSLTLQAVTSEAQVTTGYSPLLQFTVFDMDQIVAECVQMGAQMDGPIQYPAHGKVAALRSPDGHMIGLYEPTMM
eukprot:Nitzschia sp. Nitz4//scaffold36_size144017//143514//143882//NITZ4_003122-RA/size144017-processed-gene-0.97-mRNA-1//-1//CDS//3329549564//2592//frame0